MACNTEAEQSSDVDGIVSSDEVDSKWALRLATNDQHTRSDAKWRWNNSPLSLELPTKHPNPVYFRKGQGYGGSSRKAGGKDMLACVDVLTSIKTYRVAEPGCHDHHRKKLRLRKYIFPSRFIVRTVRPKHSLFIIASKLISVGWNSRLALPFTLNCLEVEWIILWQTQEAKVHTGSRVRSVGLKTSQRGLSISSGGT